MSLLLNIRDEIHFLLKCETFLALRDTLYSSVEEKLNEELNRDDIEMMIRYLLGNTQISTIVAKYQRKTMELRDFLMDKPRQLT